MLKRHYKGVNRLFLTWKMSRSIVSKLSTASWRRVEEAERDLALALYPCSPPKERSTEDVLLLLLLLLLPLEAFLDACSRRAFCSRAISTLSCRCLVSFSFSRRLERRMIPMPICHGVDGEERVGCKMRCVMRCVMRCGVGGCAGM